MARRTRAAVQLGIGEQSLKTQSEHDCPLLAAAVGAGEEMIFTPERNRGVILPISGKKSRFTTVAYSTNVRCGAITVRSAPALTRRRRRRTWRCDCRGGMDA